jgi:hypothetical protein
MQKSMALFYLNGTSRDSMYYEKEWLVGCCLNETWRCLSVFPIWMPFLLILKMVRC